MKSNSLLSHCMLVILLVMGSCDKREDQPTFVETRTQLLVGNVWGNAETVRDSGNFYVVDLPVIFNENKSAYMGGKELEWVLIDEGNIIEITNPSDPTYFEKWTIVNLTETKLHFKEFDSDGKFLLN